MFKSILLLTLAMSLTGCIVTRGQLAREEQEAQKINQIQADKANLHSQVEELQSDLRSVMGKVEELEHEKQMADRAKGKSEADKQAQDADKFKAYEESLTQMQEQVKTLSGELAAVKQVLLAKKTSAKASKKAVSKSAGPYTRGGQYFKKKDWQKAILGYQEYRERWPKGKYYKDATYKIGICFHELGMLSEAKAFYDEVIDRFPKTKEAAKAKTRLKKLKK